MSEQINTVDPSLAGLRGLESYPDYLSPRECRQFETWIALGLVSPRVDGQLAGQLAITADGERAFWALFPGGREREVIDILDENVLGVLTDIERGQSLEELATSWSGDVVILTADDVSSALIRWKEGRWKYGSLDSVVERGRALAAFERCKRD